MAGFMIGNNFTFLFIDEFIFLFQAGNGPFDSSLEIRHGNLFPVIANSQDCGFITNIGISAPAKPGVWAASCFTSSFELSFRFRVCTLNMASRPFMSGRSTNTCRSNLPGRSRAWSSTSGRLVAPDYPGTGIEPVHFNQKLVQDIFAFIAASAVRYVMATAFPDSVHFIDKNNTGRLLFGQFK